MAASLFMPPNSSISNSDISEEIRSLLKQMTVEEKVAIISGADFVSVAGVPRLNIPALKLADSTSAVKGSTLHNGTPTACFPNTGALAATWDRPLLEAMGVSIAAQARYKAAQVVLGPTINIHRDPRGGRNFESFSEDPVLTGLLAAALINGIQSQGVGTCTKHFVGNESETLRRKCNSVIDERTLREIYLAPFQWIIREAKPTAIMTSYNKLNGKYTCETPLLQDVVRNEWGFEGLIMSDWYGTTSRIPALTAGLDLEMPGPSVFRGADLIKDIEIGEFNEDSLNIRATEVLKLISRTKEAHSTAAESPGQDEATSKLCRKIAAESMVLLKNEHGVLPLNFHHSQKVAVIGIPSVSLSSGGGSAAGSPQYLQRPYDYIRASHSNPEHVRLAEGVQINKVIPMISPEILTASNGQHGVDATFWNDGDVQPVLQEHLPVPQMVIIGRLKAGLKESGFLYELTTTLTPEYTGLHTLAVQSTGSFVLLVDGAEILTAEEPQINMEDFLFVPSTYETRISVSLSAGQPYHIQLRARSRKPHNDGEPTPHAAKLCLLKERSDSEAIHEAVTLAGESDISIIFAGRNSEWEGEGSDLDSIDVTEAQVSQILAVGKASRKIDGKVIVILYGGNPFDVTAWVDEVDAILFAHYPGQEGGAALADVLTGIANPSGKLPMTWPKNLEVIPTFDNFPGHDNGNGVEVKYEEGLRIGYRYYWNSGGTTETQPAVRWNFGFGLSYTTFTFSNLKVNRVSSTSNIEREIEVNVTIKNTGSVAGAEVVQVFVEDADATVWRPAKELKSFSKVFLEPGESKVTTLVLLEKYALSFWDVESKTWYAEKGIFNIHVDVLVAQFTLEESYRWIGI